MRGAESSLGILSASATAICISAGALEILYLWARVTPWGLIQTKEWYSKLAQTGFLADSQALGPLDGVEENLEAVAILPGAFSCPSGVLGAPDMALGVGH